jgi:DNA-3-methyladenine glycosylase
MRLKRNFYEQPTLTVARQLLGKDLIRQIGKKKLVGKIVETEAYVGPSDKASHASFGRTHRCEPMYGRAGIAYIYLIYGMYWMLNVVTERKGRPCAVLIRAVEPRSVDTRILGYDDTRVGYKDTRKLGSGPGKLCKWVRVDKSFNGEDLVLSKRLWVEARNTEALPAVCLQARQDKAGLKVTETLKPIEIVAAKRIGVDYAGKWKDKKWRFYLKDNPFVSRR